MWLWTGWLVYQKCALREVLCYLQEIASRRRGCFFKIKAPNARASLQKIRRYSQYRYSQYMLTFNIFHSLNFIHFIENHWLQSVGILLFVKYFFSPGCVGQWIECQLESRRVAGSISGWGTSLGQVPIRGHAVATDRCFSPSLFPFPSL